MDNRAIALKLLLDDLGVRPEVSTLPDRKRLQKTVYLAQVAGFDLGYRFSWYLRGPYSPSLTRDYFELSKELGMGALEYEGKRLKEPLRQNLKRIRPILDPPTGTDLSQPNWLELVASLHFLVHVRNESLDQARQTLNKEKPALAPYFDKAKAELQTVGLLS